MTTNLACAELVGKGKWKRAGKAHALKTRSTGKKEEVAPSKKMKERGCRNRSEAAAQRRKTGTRCMETQSRLRSSQERRGAEEKKKSRNNTTERRHKPLEMKVLGFRAVHMCLFIFLSIIREGGRSLRSRGMALT